MSKRGWPRARKVVDLKDRLDAYRTSVAGAGTAPAKTRNLALASAASGVAALGMVPAAEAAIQHSGPQNILVANATTGIDIDGDGSSNFKFEQKYGGGKYFAQIHPLNPAPESNSVIKTSAAGYAKALPTNYLVRSALSTPAVFGIRTQIVNLGKDSNGEFPGQGNQFIGVRFNIGAPNHFGWIQVNVVAGSTSFTIVDWAYEDTPNTPILAGDTGQATAAVVPTLNEWGLIALTTLLAGAAVWKLRRLDVTAEA